jgi:hypothetical protein
LIRLDGSRTIARRHRTSGHFKYDAPLTSDIKSLARPVSGWYRAAASAEHLLEDTLERVSAATSAPGQVATLVVLVDFQQQRAAPTQAMCRGRRPHRQDVGGGTFERPTRHADLRQRGLAATWPMADLVMRSDLAAKIPDACAPNTFAANSVSAAVALTNIAILQDPALDLLNRAHKLGLEAQDHIRAFNNSPFVGEVRGRGLMIGIERVEDKATKEPLKGERLGRLMGHLTSHGVLMIPCGPHTNVMRVMPSPTIPRKLMFKALDVFGQGLGKL